MSYRCMHLHVVVQVLPSIAHRSIQFVQHAGETVFIPSLWYHAVLNISDTVAVTANFVSRANLHVVLKEVRMQDDVMGEGAITEDVT